MEKAYRVMEIFELDFGCEGRPDEQETYVGVRLDSQDGREEVIFVPDRYLYENDINEGDGVCLQEGKKLVKCRP